MVAYCRGIRPEGIVNCLVCLDVGTKTIGVARGRRDVGLAQPLLTLSRQSVRKDSERLHQLCKEQKGRLLWWAYPSCLMVQEGRSARLARQMAQRLKPLVLTRSFIKTSVSPLSRQSDA